MPHCCKYKTCYFRNNLLWITNKELGYQLTHWQTDWLILTFSSSLSVLLNLIITYAPTYFFTCSLLPLTMLFYLQTLFYSQTVFPVFCHARLLFSQTLQTVNKRIKMETSTYTRQKRIYITANKVNWPRKLNVSKYSK